MRKPRNIRPIVLTVINLILLSFLLGFLWIKFLPLYRFSEIYETVRVTVILISAVFSLAVAISIYMAWRSAKRSSEEEELNL